MLYQVATGLLSGDEISSPLRSIFNGQKNIHILFDEVTDINSDERVVHLRRGDVPYDYLILATGIQYNYSGTTNGETLLQASNRSMMPTSFAAEYCVRSSELRKWLRWNVRGPRKFVVNLRSSLLVAGP